MEPLFTLHLYFLHQNRGIYHRNIGAFTSEEGVSLLKKAKINKAFIAARGLSKEVGATTSESYEVDLKKAALGASEQKILLLDSSKMGKAWFVKFADLEDFDIIITDSDVDEKYVKMIEDLGITLCIV